MSGSELGRLMHEVTARPPVDVDFGAVEHLVRRRQRRLRSAAGGAAVAAVAVIVAVPVLGGWPSPGHVAPHPAGPAPHPATSRIDSWNTLSWAVPSDWPASDAYPDHSRPSNAFIDGPYLGSARVPLAPPTPRPTQGSGVLASAAPTLPAGAVVGWFSYGLRSDPLTPASFDSDAMTYLPADCAAMGAAHTFHAVRQFGTAAAGSNLALDGCINAADPSTQEAQLAAVLASVKDSAYPASAPSPTAAAPITDAAAELCRAALGTFATATLTTISEVHSIPRGGPAQASDSNDAFGFSDVFKGAPATDPAAWCWKLTDDGDGYEAWIVHAGDPPYPSGTTLGLSQPPPSGAPAPPP